jgi:ComF family protein
MLRHLANLFFPKSCAGCHAFLQTNEEVICTSCRHKIPLTYHLDQPENEFVQKFYGRIDLEFGGALFYFHKKGVVQEMIHQLKYKGQEEVGVFIGNWFGEESKSNALLASAAMVIPVPIHKKRRRIRGYNQVDAFGQAIANKLNITFDTTILYRKTHATSQTKKTLLERTEVHLEVFDVNFSELHHGKHFILVDDVITTGSTLESCCRALLKIPDVKISIVCMAMSHS